MMSNQFTPERAEHELQKRRELERRFAEWLERQVPYKLQQLDVALDGRIRESLFAAFRAGAESQ